MNELDDYDYDYDDRNCPDCMCCTAEGCRFGEGSTCPTDRLGDYACPCTCS